MTDTRYTALVEAVKQLDFKCEPGCVLYSSGLSLSNPNGIYLMGVNPGGVGEEKVLLSVKHPRVSNPDNVHCNYFDRAWGSSKPGESWLQKRVTRLLGHFLTLPDIPKKSDCHHDFQEKELLRRTLCTNLVFVQTINEQKLNERYTDKHAVRDACWTVHETLIAHLKPKVIMCYGKTPFDYVLKQAKACYNLTEHSASQGRLKWRATKINLLGQERYLIGLPHLSRYDVDHLQNEQSNFYGHDLIQQAIMSLAILNKK